MELRPILSAMRRNKVGATLIAVQMGITLAILCNSLFIVQQRLASSHRPSGMNEADVFVITNQWVGNPTDLAARQQTDMDALRSLPGVLGAYTTNSFPLSNGGQTEGCSLRPEQATPTARCAAYIADEQGLSTMGVKLVAGRNFTPAEVTQKAEGDQKLPAAVIITKELADTLYKGQPAVGKTLYITYHGGGIPIVGVVEGLQVPWVGAGGWGSTFFGNSVIAPFQYAAQYSHYVVRAKPGLIGATMQVARDKLFDINRGRVIVKMQTMTEARTEAYRDDRGLALVLCVVCVALLAVTAFGIVGLTSYWVAQRRRQIGIRRALGATQVAIVRYFQTENFIIAAAGVILGVTLAIGLNLWMVNTFEMERLHLGYPLAGGVFVLILGQAAAFWPALRAASISPALATRAA